MPWLKEGSDFSTILEDSPEGMLQKHTHKGHKIKVPFEKLGTTITLITDSSTVIDGTTYYEIGKESNLYLQSRLNLVRKDTGYFTITLVSGEMKEAVLLYDRIVGPTSVSDAVSFIKSLLGEDWEVLFSQAYGLNSRGEFTLALQSKLPGSGLSVVLNLEDRSNY